MRPILWVPLLLFAALVMALTIGLFLKPREIPSAMIAQPVPAFDLPPLWMSGEGLQSNDLAQGEAVLLNVFASWCAPCRIEHPFLMELADEGIPLYGLNYKDKPEDALAFLGELGNPYRRIGADRDGRVGIDFGVYGVPETYVINGQGQITYKHIGPILPQNQDQLRQAIKKAAQKSPADEKAGG
ncbi:MULTISPECIES: DsbE family thiol:disulfide interchange protein [unclassified Iodidimonas]|jgi:cytochrome c biogenesis protein CcmG/thiol:disulfide interchange protein DsbE|uniref:DsbE family thiol:disulfide interchange protein n=1 Tax=unclassified Iodidimonas TaxID=2626145 RepID=UPI002482D7F2|nr:MULTISPECIES: DsbE family thiol:disulfide interchange protein [unclassified Iodidimonas]